MSNRTINLDDRLYEYLLQVSLRESPALAALREETGSLPESNMQISPEQGQFMALLVKLLGASRCIEIGTFTGYSALAVAEALPEDGKIVACDLSTDFTGIARRHWQIAGLAHKIDLRIAPAIETLAALIDAGEAGSFDMAFIDADKPGYDAYFEHCLRLLRTNGLIMIDNVLWDGRVTDTASRDENTVALRTLNAKLARDSRIDISLLPLGDGLTLARKR
jgi:predicted O-methyltransferase YrrM